MDPGIALLATVIAAAIGSTGVAGLLTGGLQLSRSARLRRGIEASSALLPGLGGDTAAAKALTLAVQTDTLRLAAMSLLRPPVRILQMLGLVIFSGVASVILALAAQSISATSYPKAASLLSSESSRTFVVLIALFGVSYILALVWSLDALIRLRRERFVRAALAGGDVDYEQVLAHDFIQNRFDDRRAIEHRARVQSRLVRFGIIQVEPEPAPRRWQRLLSRIR